MTDTREHARERLGGLLRDGVSRATALRETLGLERSALERRDAGALESVIGAKETQIRELARVERDRAALLRDAGFDGTGREDMRAIAAWCGDASDVLAAWDEYCSIASDCDALNRGNGAVIRLRQQQIADGLALVRGADRETATYGPGPVGGRAGGARELTEA